MGRWRQITSVQNERVKAVARLHRRQRDRRRAEQFVAEGVREIGRALQTGLEAQEFYLCRALAEAAGIADEAERLAGALPEVVRRVEVSEEVLKRMAYRAEPEGLLAVFAQPDWSLDLLPAVDEHTRYLVAVETAKPGNLGAMVRTADAAGFTAVLAAGAPVDAFNPNAIRASTGAVFSVPTISVEPQHVIDYLQANRVRLIAATPDAVLPYTDADWAAPLALVIGPEDRGLAPPWLDAADRSGGQHIAIPMRGRVADSLNAASAAAVLMYEAVRGRAI